MTSIFVFWDEMWNISEEDTKPEEKPEPNC
jgi:hypothetical protein